MLFASSAARSMTLQFFSVAMIIISSNSFEPSYYSTSLHLRTSYNHIHSFSSFLPLFTHDSNIELPIFSSSILIAEQYENEEPPISSLKMQEQSTTTTTVDNAKSQKPNWMKCINGIAPKTGALNEIVAILANVSLEHANYLIDIGAVWARTEPASEEEILNQYRDGASSSQALAQVKYSDLAPGWNSPSHQRDEYKSSYQDVEEYVSQMESRRYNRILSPVTISKGADVRIYPQPRRFPSCSTMDHSRLLHEDTTFLIVDKPPMLPTQADASNYYECCPGCVAKYMSPGGRGFPSIDKSIKTPPRPYICHRVDSCVGGCVVLSKDRYGQAVFEKYQRERKLRKLYLAVTTKPVPLGKHIHWMWAQSLKRGNFGGTSCQLVSHIVPESRKKAKKWVRCIMEVVECRPTDITADDTGYDPGTKQHYQSKIRLVTGRKHQVRAQLSSLGCPVIRDTLYEPIAGMTFDMLQQGGEVAMMMDKAVEKCQVPREPIGLQAHAILFGGIGAKALEPWWGDI